MLMMVISSADGSAQKFEVGAFGGGSVFSRPSFTSGAVQPPASDRIEYSFADGGIFGIRARQNLTNVFGLEQSWAIYGTNNTVFNGSNADLFQGVSLGARQQQLYFNGNFYTRPRESGIRPYLTAGVGWSFFSPTDESQAQSAPYFTTLLGSPTALDNDTVFAFNFGAGALIRLSNTVALDFSVRDFVNKSPTFGIPEDSDHDIDNNVQFQGALHFRFGGIAPPIAHQFMVAPAIETANASMCPGESTTLSIVASDTIPENQVTYRWTLDGQEVSTSPQYTFVAPKSAGPYNVGVRVFYDTANLDKKALKAVQKNPGVPTDRRTTLTVRDYRPPTAVANLDRTIIQRNERLRVTSASKGSECSGNLAYRWSASDGRLIAGPDAAVSEFDGSNLAFSETVQGQQCRPVKVTLEVTDQRGGVATDAKDLQVCYTAPVAAAPPPPPPPPPAPAAVQLSDINFATNSTRVNNCAKRVLANELYPQLTAARYSDYDVVLVGHRDTAERETGRQASSTLDRERVLNAAAFLSAKGSTCKDIELTRVKVAWKGTEQGTEFRSNFCDSSTVERRRDTVSSTDSSARNRRVEIWLVPKGAELPSGVSTTLDSSSDIVKLGCPR
jgi:outer membrane protein OmpA-like peptidoglycan-associated protein